MGQSKVVGRAGPLSANRSDNLGDSAGTDALGDGADILVLASPPVELKSAHAKALLDLRDRVGETLQRRWQPDHVANAGIEPLVLYDMALPCEILVVVSPDMADGPVLGLAFDAQGLHERDGRPDVLLELSDAPAADQLTAPGGVVSWPAPRCVPAPDRQRVECIGMHPARGARDHLHHEREFVLDLGQAVGDLEHGQSRSALDVGWLVGSVRLI